MKLPQEEFDPYYAPYIEKSTKAESIAESLVLNKNSVSDFYSNIPENKLNYAYAEGKWTPKDMLLHLIDAERVFSYRAMHIARQDQTELAGFEQDDYVVTGKANERPVGDLIEEYNTVRNATIALFNSFSDKELKSIGKASGSPISVRAIGHIITGHENHHNNVIRERYL